MAKEKGFYKSYGLEVNIQEVDGKKSVVEKVLSNEADYGVGDSAIIYDKMRGKEVTALFAVFQHSPLALMTLKSSGIDSVDKLKGKKIMLSVNNLNNASIMSMLSSRKVDNFKLIPMTHKIEDLLQGKVDAYAVYVTDQPFLLKQKGIGYTLLNPMDYGFDFYGDILFTSSKELNEHPERVRRFTEASLKGWKYAFTHVNETIKVILEKYNTQYHTYNSLKHEEIQMRKFSGIDQNRFGEITQERVNYIGNILTLINPHIKKGSLEDFVYRYDPLRLTESEERFLREIKTVRMCNNPDWMPIEYYDEKGEAKGIAIDTMDLIQKKLQNKLTFVPVHTNSWKESLRYLEEGKCDILPSASVTKKRLKYANFTDPYLYYDLFIITKNDRPYIGSLEDVIDRKMARKKGSGLIAKLKTRYPNIQIIETESHAETFRKVASGEAYFTIATLPVVSYFSSKFALSNLKIVGFIDQTYALSIAVRKDLPELLSIMQKGLNSVSKEEHNGIYLKWRSIKMEQKVDYAFISKVAAGIFILVLFFYYRQTQLKKHNKRLEELTVTDSLTGIYNRVKLDQELDKRERMRGTCSLIVLDIDYFKEVNDIHGHLVGDEVLKSVAKLISNTLHRKEIFGRWGGEEFMIITPYSKEETLDLAEKIRYLLSDNYLEEIGKSVTASFGVAFFESDDTVTSLVKKADAALYRAKENGRNRVAEANE